MSNNYSMSEIIDLIFYFRMAPDGIHKDDIDEEPYIRQIIEDGYADEDENEWYEVNQAGDEFMHSYIKSITEDIIQFINGKGREVALKILALCALIAVCTSQWQPLLIIGIMIAIGIVIAYGASYIMAQIEICRDSLCGYLRA